MWGHVKTSPGPPQKKKKKNLRPHRVKCQMYCKQFQTGNVPHLPNIVQVLNGWLTIVQCAPARAGCICHDQYLPGDQVYLHAPLVKSCEASSCHRDFHVPKQQAGPGMWSLSWSERMLNSPSEITDDVAAFRLSALWKTLSGKDFQAGNSWIICKLSTKRWTQILLLKWKSTDWESGHTLSYKLWAPSSVSGWEAGTCVRTALSLIGTG